MNWLSSLFKKITRKEIYYTNWEWAWKTGLYFGRGRNNVWMYKVMPTEPLMYAPDEAKRSAMTRLSNVMKELASVSRTTRITSLASRRKIHMLSIQYLAPVDTSNDPANLSDFLDNHVYTHLVPRRLVFLGVSLQRKLFQFGSSAPIDTSGFMKTIQNLADRAGLDTPASLSTYSGDIEAVEKMLYRNGFRDPTPDQASVLETWYQNKGDGMPRIQVRPSYIEVENPWGDNLFWEMKSISSWRSEIDDLSPWLAMAMGERQGAWVVSARGELEKGSVMRLRIKTQRGKMDDTRIQTLESGDYERPEDEALAEEMADMEEYYSNNPDEPALANFSVSLARRLYLDPSNPSEWEGANDRLYSAMLKESYDIHSVDMQYSQMEVLQEMLPCAVQKLSLRRPFKHYVTLGTLAASGIGSCSDMGDTKGAHLGYTEPDGTEVRLDFNAASSKNLPPVMALVGQPGSGKTVAIQHLAHQSSISKVQTILVNPKPNDTLSPLLTVTGGEHIVLGSKSEPGSLDPFRFSDTQDLAVNTGISFLTTIIPDINSHQAAIIEDGMRSAENPECMMQAVSNIKQRELRDAIKTFRSNPIAALCLGNEGGESFLMKGAETARQGVLLVEFGTDIQLPSSSNITLEDMQMAERYGVAAVGLLMQAANEMIAAARRGQLHGGSGSFLIIDEAWIMLLSPHLVNTYLESLGRLGRSLDVTVVLATQRATDIENANLNEYISRALFLKLIGKQEQNAALRVLGLDPNNEDYRRILEQGGSRKVFDYATRKEVTIAPTGWYKDLDGRVGVIRTEIPQQLLKLYSTNPEERKELLQELKAGSFKSEEYGSLSALN